MGRGMTPERDTILPKYLARVRGNSLSPGTHDCALFAAGWVRLCTGVDLAKDWRGKYRTLDEGTALLAAAGFADPIELAEHHLQEVGSWMQAQVGDIAVVGDDNGAGADVTAFGIIGGSHIHVVGLRGLDYVILSRAIRVFRP